LAHKAFGGFAWTAVSGPAFRYNWSLGDGAIMTTTVYAVYENGVLRPLAPLALPEGQRVRVIVAPEEAAPSQRAASILAEIAALPVQGSGDPHTSRDHDRVLYGGENQP
jgi:predicted DNA-binding antitoxin AbrB/MazE fold protein